MEQYLDLFNNSLPGEEEEGSGCGRREADTKAATL